MIVWLTRRYIEDSCKANRVSMFSKNKISVNSNSNRLGLFARIAHKAHTSVLRGVLIKKGIRGYLSYVRGLESSIYMWDDILH